MQGVESTPDGISPVPLPVSPFISPAGPVGPRPRSRPQRTVNSTTAGDEDMAPFELQFEPKTVPSDDYIALKGQPVPDATGKFIYSYVVYQGVGDPDQALGELADLYFDRSEADPRIFVKLSSPNGSVWQSWVYTATPDLHFDEIAHPFFPTTVRLWAQNTKGIIWTRYHTFHQDKLSAIKAGTLTPSIAHCIQQTLDERKKRKKRKRQEESPFSDMPRLKLARLEVASTSAYPELPYPLTSPRSPTQVVGLPHPEAHVPPIHPVPNITSFQYFPPQILAPDPSTSSQTSIFPNILPSVQPVPPAVSTFQSGAGPFIPITPFVQPVPPAISTFQSGVSPSIQVPIAPIVQPVHAVLTFQPAEPEIEIPAPPFSPEPILEPRLSRGHSPDSPLSALSNTPESAGHHDTQATTSTDSPPVSADGPPSPQALIDVLRKAKNLLVEGRAGIEFPSKAQLITWVSGIVTVLPWTKSHKGEGVSLPFFTFSPFLFSSPHRMLKLSAIWSPRALTCPILTILCTPQVPRPTLQMTSSLFSIMMRLYCGPTPCLRST